MKNTLYILLLLLCTACTNHRPYPALLTAADSLMNIRPDSALQLLHSIHHEQQLTQAHKAYYALLLTQAQDKNYLDSLQSDSLISIAVDYFKHSNEKEKTARAYFYCGKLHAMKGNDTTAMQAYLKADNMLQTCHNFWLKAKVQEYIGSLNNKQKMYDAALCNFQQALSYNQQIGDTSAMAYIYRNIAHTYYQKQYPDSVLYYTNAAIQLINNDSLESVFPSLMQQIGMVKRDLGDYEEAIDYFLAAIKLNKIKSSGYNYRLSLAMLYIKTADYNSAKEQLEQVLTAPSLYTRAGAYNYLYLLSKLSGDYLQALEYKEISDSLLQKYQKQQAQEKLLKMQQIHEVEKLHLQHKLMQEKKKMQVYFLLVIILIIIWIAIKIYRYQQFRIKQLKNEIYLSLRTIERNEQEIGKYMFAIQELEEEKNALKQAKVEIVRLKQNVQLLLNKNKEIKESLSVAGIHVIENLKLQRLIVENLTSEEKEQLFAYIDLLYSNLSTRLKNEYKLNDNSRIFAILLRIGFTQQELISAFQCESATIIKKKQRLKKRFELNSQNDLNEFLLKITSNLST